MVNKFLEDAGVPVVGREDNPPNVPQLRPIEDFWGLLKQEVYKGGWEATSEDQLKRRILRAVEILNPEVPLTMMRRVALALRRHMTDKEKEVDFIKKIDSGMDVLNSAHPGDVKLLRRGYSGRPEQEEALAALEKEVAGMRVGNARHLYPFQKGLLVTIRAVPGPCVDSRKVFKTSNGTETYLLTRKLAQDKLESFSN
ncbi:hypothetical protein FJT64_026068 [Amphibalanus amphitrite]|uniref:Uncharacterized protein n=1 Tax=Amphibalanus amphitrite TaxID=1232801 RepID=A0A6A4W335_AMPAM|nr:hypothetical protein FJT64_026068 [Amphibalanus amphitrite]